MKIERKKTTRAEVYTASLNDIMFFLLLFFLIISTMATPMALKVMLPKSASGEQIAAKEPINMSITQDKRYYIEDTEVALDDIEPRLRAMIGTDTEQEGPNILLQVDHTVDVQTLVRVMGIGSSLNLKVTLIVEKE
jgi:biopolymer transport protein ExbD